MEGEGYGERDEHKETEEDMDDEIKREGWKERDRGRDKEEKECEGEIGRKK